MGSNIEKFLKGKKKDRVSGVACKECIIKLNKMPNVVFVYLSFNFVPLAKSIPKPPLILVVLLIEFQVDHSGIHEF